MTCNLRLGLLVMFSALLCAHWTTLAHVRGQDRVESSEEGWDDWEALPLEAPDAGADPVAATEVPGEAPAVDAGSTDRWSYESFGSFGTELRVFFRDAVGADQPDRLSSSLVFRPGQRLDVGRRVTLRAIGYLRLDQYDDERTSVDLREGLLEVRSEALTTTLGIQKVFWGVTESRHLVDIINQTDFADSLSGEEKRGQLMALLTYDTGGLGTVDAYVTSWFRPPLYPGPSGRPGVPLPLLEDPLYESRLGRWHPGVALRWSAAAGELDWALSYFYGLGREPELLPVMTANGVGLEQRFDPIHQGGLEAQWTREAWLWKLETIVRQGQGPTFAAVTGGVEYTFSDIVRSGIDLGLVIEMNYDGRDNQTYNFYDDDLFTGMRLSLNDRQSTELLVAALTDLGSGSTLFSGEASRRLGDSWKLEIGAWVVHAQDQDDPLYWFRRDHYVQAELQYHF